MALTVVYINLEDLQDVLDHNGEKVKMIMRLDGLLPTNQEVGRILVVIDQ